MASDDNVDGYVSLEDLGLTKKPKRVVVQINGEEHIYEPIPSKQKIHLGEYLTIWKENYGGYFPATRFAKLLRAAEKDHGRERVIYAFKRYCEATEAQYASVSAFCSKIGAWIVKPSEPREKVNLDKQWKE